MLKPEYIAILVVLAILVLGGGGGYLIYYLVHKNDKPKTDMNYESTAPTGNLTAIVQQLFTNPLVESNPNFAQAVPRAGAGTQTQSELAFGESEQVCWDTCSNNSKCKSVVSYFNEVNGQKGCWFYSEPVPIRIQAANLKSWNLHFRDKVARSVDATRATTS